MTNNQEGFLITRYFGKAIIWGFFADMLFKAVLQIIILALVGGYLINNGMSEAQFVEYVEKIQITSPLFIVLVIIGIISAMFGGFIAGRIAKISELMVAFILAVINTIMSLILFIYDSHYPGVLFITIVIISFFATMQGGTIAKKMRLRKILH